MKNKKGFVFTIGFVMAIFLAIVLFIVLASGGLGALWKTGSTVADIVNILGSIPAIVWVFLGFIFLVSLIRGGRR